MKTALEFTRAFVLAISLSANSPGLIATEPAEISAEARAILANHARPRMFVTAAPAGNGLRSLADVRRGIREGTMRELWENLLAKVDRERTEPPLSPVAKARPGGAPRDRDFVLVATTANRILDAALVAMVRDERAYADAALRQIDALFDEAQWPDWQNLGSIRAGLKADLRHGQLVAPIAVAYDWMYALLTDAERHRIIAGLDRCAIQRFHAGVKAKDHWTFRPSNWMLVVTGGFGIAGMALGEDHPDSGQLIDFARPRLENYLKVLGPDGEFNETVQYAGSIGYLVEYFSALRYASLGRDNPFTRHSFTRFYQWYMQMTFPPGRVANFGDPAIDAPVVATPASAVAAATQDPVLQWFYETYRDKMLPEHRARALELLYYDSDLKKIPPGARMPLARVYHHNAKLISSRSDWNPWSTTSVVYAKAGRETFHSHADWGQVCLDGFGERLVTDIGMGDADSAQDRYSHYYHLQQWGHNVLVFGENTTGGVSWHETKRTGTTTWSSFDKALGGAWTMDLSDVYGDGKIVTRTVAHFLPRVIVVVDNATLPDVQPISLRWHLVAPAEPDKSGIFTLHGQKATLSGRVLRTDGAAETLAARHAYAAPYNRNGQGPEFKQRHEPYVELRAKDDHCRIVSLFCVFGPGETAEPWRETADGWGIATPERNVTVSLRDGALVVQNAHATKAVRAPMPGPGDLTIRPPKKTTDDL